MPGVRWYEKGIRENASPEEREYAMATNHPNALQREYSSANAADL